MVGSSRVLKVMGRGDLGKGPRPNDAVYQARCAALFGRHLHTDGTEKKIGRKLTMKVVAKAYKQIKGGGESSSLPSPTYHEAFLMPSRGWGGIWARLTPFVL